MSAHVLPPGEPNLVTALLAAAKFNGAGYVNCYDGVPGWYVGTVIPRGCEAYFRVLANRVYGRDHDGNEFLFAQIVDQAIIPEKAPCKL